MATNTFKSTELNAPLTFPTSLGSRSLLLLWFLVSQCHDSFYFTRMLCMFARMLCSYLWADNIDLGGHHCFRCRPFQLIFQSFTFKKTARQTTINSHIPRLDVWLNFTFRTFGSFLHYAGLSWVKITITNSSQCDNETSKNWPPLCPGYDVSMDHNWYLCTNMFCPP